LRNAVRDGRWKSITALAGSVAPIGEEGPLLNYLSSQALLHERAAQVLESPIVLSGDLPDLGSRQKGALWQLALAATRNYAGLEGDRNRAAAVLKQELAFQRGDPTRWPLARFPQLEIELLQKTPSASSSPLRLIGVTRPVRGSDLAIGEVGSPIAVQLVGLHGPIARGLPIEVLGQWQGKQRIFECHAVTGLGQGPDYLTMCKKIEESCLKAGLNPEFTWIKSFEMKLDLGVTWARRARRKGEWAAVLAASDILEEALRKAELSLEVLARVHTVVVGQAARGAGQFRRTPAVVRWRGNITYRPPGAKTARRQTQNYLNGLGSKLSTESPARHPVALAAEAVASLTSSHPFSDGNGRVARAIATWLLLRSGYHRRGENTLSSFFDEYCAEHYMALLNCHVAPWNWHQFFCDAVLTTFDRAPEKRQCVGPARTSHQ
jgi:fido (protein-threonine AMPylation protein)